MGNDIGLGPAKSQLISKRLFGHVLKSICIDFRSTNMGSSVIGTGRSEGSLLPNFYRFRSHYPLITYLDYNVIL